MDDRASSEQRVMDSSHEEQDSADGSSALQLHQSRCDSVECWVSMAMRGVMDYFQRWVSVYYE